MPVGLEESSELSLRAGLTCPTLDVGSRAFAVVTRAHLPSKLGTSVISLDGGNPVTFWNHMSLSTKVPPDFPSNTRKKMTLSLLVLQKKRAVTQGAAGAWRVPSGTDHNCGRGNPNSLIRRIGARV